jgi:hypothetical protein
MANNFRVVNRDTDTKKSKGTSWKTQAKLSIHVVTCDDTVLYVTNFGIRFPVC